MADGGADLCELLDRVADLLVEDAAVRDDDDRVEDGRALLRQPDELVGQPGDRVGLAAAGRMLDQIPLADAMPAGVRQQLPDHVELVIARKNLDRLLLARLLVLELDDLGVVLDDVGQAVASQDRFQR